MEKVISEIIEAAIRGLYIGPFLKAILNDHIEEENWNWNFKTWRKKIKNEESWNNESAFAKN